MIHDKKKLDYPCQGTRQRNVQTYEGNSDKKWGYWNVSSISKIETCGYKLTRSGRAMLKSQDGDFEGEKKTIF